MAALQLSSTSSHRGRSQIELERGDPGVVSWESLERGALERDKEVRMWQKRELATDDLGVFHKQVQKGSEQNAQKVARYKSGSAT